MPILDRYVLQLFTRVLLICGVSLSGMYVIIDVFNNLEEFITYGEQSGGIWRVLGEYYGARVLTFLDYTSGLLALIAAMFTATWMQRSNELTAVVAAGIPPRRICKPLLAAAVAVSLLAVVNREMLIPQFRDKLSRNAQNWLGERALPLRPRYDNQTDIYLGGHHTFANEQRIEKPSFRLPVALPGFGRQLQAANAFYHPPDANRPGGYLLEGVTQPEGIDALPSQQIDGRRVILTPADTPWLVENQCFVVSAVGFDQLAAGDSWRRYSSSLQLISALHNPSLDYGADVRVTVHARLVQPILDLCLLILGLPLVLSGHNRNLFVAAGMCLLIVAGFFLVVLACHGLGNNYLLSPAFAAWCPLMFVAPCAYAVSHPIWE